MAVFHNLRPPSCLTVPRPAPLPTVLMGYITTLESDLGTRIDSLSPWSTEVCDFSDPWGSVNNSPAPTENVTSTNHEPDPEEDREQDPDGKSCGPSMVRAVRHYHAGVLDHTPWEVEEVSATASPTLYGWMTTCFQKAPMRIQ